MKLKAVKSLVWDYGQVLAWEAVFMATRELTRRETNWRLEAEVSGKVKWQMRRLVMWQVREQIEAQNDAEGG